MKIVLTKEEVEQLEENILVDPCAFIGCEGIPCELCPFHDNAVQLRREQEKFMKTINSFDIEGE